MSVTQGQGTFCDLTGEEKEINGEGRKKEQDCYKREKVCVCTHTWRGGGEEWEEKEEGKESMKVRYLDP